MFSVSVKFQNKALTVGVTNYVVNVNNMTNTTLLVSKW